MKKLIDSDFVKVLPVLLAFESGDLLHYEAGWVRGIGATLLVMAALLQAFNHSRMESK